MLALAREPGVGQKDPRPHVTVMVGGRKSEALVDTGASISVMSEKEFDKLPGNEYFKELLVPESFQIAGASGADLKVKGRFEVPFAILGIDVVQPIYVVKCLEKHSWIIGIDLIRALHLAITSDDVQIRTVLPDLSPHRHSLYPIADFTVPARTVMRKRLHLPDMTNVPHEGETCVVTNHFMVPHAWNGLSKVGPDGEVWCVLANVLHEDVRCHAGDAIASIDVVEEADVKELADEHVMEITTGRLVDNAAEPDEGPAAKMSAKEEAEFKSKLNIKCDSEDERRKYEELCLKFHDVFSKHKHDLGRADVISHKIHMKDINVDPSHVRQFPIPLAHKQDVYDYVDKLLAQGAIELSRSAYNSPIFCVPKPKDEKGGLRKVLDFRGVNAQSVPDRYTIRDPRECVDEVGLNGSVVFSAIDLTSGFWQQNLEEESRQYTAFTVPGKATRFQWTVTPMGLQGAPASFARMMDYITRGISSCIGYVDDLLVHTKTHAEQRAGLEQVFLRFRKYNLKANMGKSEIAASELEYLGYHLSGKGVGPGLQKMRAMRRYPEPDSIKKIREFLGMANYFRFMIPSFSQNSGHLTALLKNESTYKKGPLPLAAANAFAILKGALCSSPVVRPPADVGDWHVTTDASQGDALHPGGLGAVLTQVVEGEERVVAYASRGLKSFEKNYSAFLLEMAAATWAIDYWHVYLAGRFFELHTDHMPLTSMSTIHKKTLNRLQQQLLEYHMVIKYKPGPQNVLADALSRNPVDALRTQDAFNAEPVAALSDYSGSLQQAQEKDDFCEDIKEYIKTKVLPTHSDAYAKKIIRIAKDAHVTNGVLYFFHQREGMRPVQSVLVPDSLKKMIIEAAHNSWDSGHGGEDRTKARIFMRYYWPGVHNDVAQYVKSCLNCQQAKGKKPLPCPLKSLPICEGRNERVHIDLWGPAKSSSHAGNKYVMVMTDAWSKVVELAAIPEKTAEEVAKTFFERWICRYSVPLQVVSDNGKEFANCLFTELSQLLGFKQTKTSPYHPASNSSAESFNRSMKKYLRSMLSNEETLDWELMLPMLQFSYNTHVHRTTLESPFWLTYHADPRLPYFSLEETRPLYSDSPVQARFKAFSETQKLVFKNQWDAREVREAYYNKKTKERSFDEGDRVLFFKDASPLKVNDKLYKHWQGPYYVVKKVTPLNYSIQKNPLSKPFTVHIEKIKHLHENVMKIMNDSKKCDPESASSYAPFQGHQEDDGEAQDVGLGQVMHQGHVERQFAEPDLHDLVPKKPDLKESDRVTRSMIKKGIAKL